MYYILVFPVISMPGVSVVIVAMLSKTDINIYVVTATRRTDIVPGEIIYFLPISPASQFLTMKECSRISVFDLHFTHPTLSRFLLSY